MRMADRTLGPGRGLGRTSRWSRGAGLAPIITIATLMAVVGVSEAARTIRARDPGDVPIAANNNVNRAMIARMLTMPATFIINTINEVAARSPLTAEPPEASMTGPELILHWGYPGETHATQTEDGYVVSLFRVPWGKGQNPREASRPVALLMHGVLQTADQWLMRGPGEDLAFILADLGFDVWMGNFRGSTYSRKHQRMSARRQKFWDFSWQENAVYDLPAMLDYISAVTDQEEVLYVGHSMGTTALLALLADRPEYNRRIRAAFLMAPVVYFEHSWGPLAAARDTLPSLANARLVGEAFPRGSGDACKTALPLCMAVYNSGGGSSPGEFNTTLFRILLGHYPSGASYGQLIHYLQVMVSGEFKKFDYGPKENVARYGQETPPPFRLSNVVAPVYLHYAGGDPFSPVEDVKRLAKEVPGTKMMIKVPLEDYGHTDHLYAIHSYELEFKQIVNLMLDSIKKS